MTTYQVVLSIGSNVANPKLADAPLAALKNRSRELKAGSEANAEAPAVAASTASLSQQTELSSPEILMAVAQLLGDELQKISSIYRTPAWGKTDQPDFYNATLLVETSSEPKEFLHRMQRIELDFGRERHEHWGPRTLDIDLIQIQQADQEITSTDPELILPHPYAAQRAFVLLPWAEIQPDAVLESIPIAQHLAKLEEDCAQIHRLEEES